MQTNPDRTPQPPAAMPGVARPQPVPPAPATVWVLHPMPLLATGIAAALQPLWPAQVLPGPWALADGGAAVVVTDHAGGMALAAQGRGRRILVLQQGARAWGVRMALQAGVLGYVNAECTLDELHQAVASVQRGARYLCPVASAGMADSVVETALTPREMDVLQLLGDGLDNKTISLRLDIALGTVKSHVKAVLEKLGASSRTQAVAAGQARGLVVAGAGWRGSVRGVPAPMAPMTAPQGLDRHQRSHLPTRPAWSV
ncbi:response regulator transcription factor [Aquincola tertiaricarbonis]|uniref:Response regulator transcription factor n=1 Tax=Aquincola tertiaricarbonis TaxID=391953 RepID=A0ABY4S311_AQUTE|nr:response regulator transcription factor [Aquincola tertiaricarbonis]URI07060.1 response regulator transcription factor [Aquincola tertiaricarbonis]